MLVQVEIASDLPLALCEAGFLQEWNSEDPAEIRKAIEQVFSATHGSM